jgi:hypothetical protein
MTASTNATTSSTTQAQPRASADGDPRGAVARPVPAGGYSDKTAIPLTPPAGMVGTVVLSHEVVDGKTSPVMVLYVDTLSPAISLTPRDPNLWIIDVPAGFDLGNVAALTAAIKVAREKMPIKPPPEGDAVRRP